MSEPNGSFGTEISAGSFADIPVIEGTTTLVMDSPYETPKLLQQYLHGYPSKVAMPKRANFSFSTNMRGMAARAADAGQHTASSLTEHQLFLTAFGGFSASVGTTIATTSSVTVLNVTSAAGMAAGNAIALPTGTGGTLECREIKSISSNAVTLKLALSNAPSNGTIVYGAGTFYFAALDGGSVLSLQTIVEGLSTVDRWLLKGGQVSAPPAFKLAPGSIPTADWAWQYAQHARADGTESTMNLNSALSDQNYADTSINAVMDSEFRIAPHSSSALAGTMVDASEINIVPNFAVEPHTSPGGINNIKQWVPSRVDGPPATANFLDPYQAVDWRTARTAETDYAMTYQVGSSVTNGGFMISVPRVIVDNFQRETVGGLAGERVQFYARPDNQSSGSGSLQISPVKCHFF